MSKRQAGRSGGAEDVARQLEALDDAWQDADFARALALADALLERTPSLAEALQFRAAALAELDRLPEARDAYARALKAAPEQLELMLDAAGLLVDAWGEDREALEEALALCARGKRLAQRADDVELVFEFLLLEGVALNQLGESARALESLDAALGHAPRHPDALLERAYALFELCRFDDARAAFERALEVSPDDAWAHHHLGLLAERRGDTKEAKRRFTRARELAPEEFPPPVHLSDAEFDAALEKAVAGLPERVKGYLDNVTIAVEDLPRDDDLLGQDPPLSPAILGVFRGPTILDNTVMGGAVPMHPSIVLYQKNLERFARTRDELVEQIGITLMHEVGHLIGLDEEDLWERGLD